MQYRTETGLRFTDRNPSTDALVALCDQDYGFLLYDYESATLFCREKAILIRDQFVSRRCPNLEELFLGDLHVAEGSAELRFEEKPFAVTALKELLWWTFGCYSPLQSEAARVYEYNPAVFSGEQALGTLKEIVAEFGVMSESRL